MTYKVLKDFKDDQYKLELAVGETFIPASIHYPQNLTDARVADGTLKLLTKVAPFNVNEPEPVAETESPEVGNPVTGRGSITDVQVNP
jgi:hypothetical protein